MTHLKRAMITAICTALCVVLPMALHAVPEGGRMFSPMHIPVLLCGLVCGWAYGLFAGLAGPVLSMLITSMPPAAMLPPMMVELAFFGLITGLIMQFVRTGKLILDLYIAMVPAMLLGRVLAGVFRAWIFTPGAFSVEAWVSGYLVFSLPGIIAHLILIPILVLALERARLIPRRYAKTESL